MPLTHSIALESALRARGLTVAVGPTWTITAGNCRKVQLRPGEPHITVIEDGRERSVCIGNQPVDYLVGVVAGLLGVGK